MAEQNLSGPSADYAHARCCAITKKGTRCTGRWDVSVGCMFGWNATTGRGVEGPNVVLCWRHAHYVLGDGRPSVRDGKRFRVVHGWLGGANKYNYGTAVFARERAGDFAPAAWWWARRRSIVFGDSQRRDAA